MSIDPEKIVKRINGEVETIVETEGENRGRIKDGEMAYDMALLENAQQQDKNDPGTKEAIRDIPKLVIGDEVTRRLVDHAKPEDRLADPGEVNLQQQREATKDAAMDHYDRISTSRSEEQEESA